MKTMEGPDIEVEADRWQDEQFELAGLNSCDALRIIDGVPLTLPEDEE